MKWANVAFIVLRGDVGLKRIDSGWKKPKEYPCPATIEHVEAAGDTVYWLLDRSPGKPLSGLDALSENANGFGLHLTPVEDIRSQRGRLMVYAA